MGSQRDAHAVNMSASSEDGGLRRAGIAVSAAAVAFAMLLFVTEANAAFPGANGRIAFAGSIGGEQQRDLFTILPDGSGLQQLTATASFEEDPSWSADGENLVFSRVDANASQVVTLRVSDGTETVIRRTRSSETPTTPSFSPDGGEVAFTKQGNLYTVGFDGERPRRILAAHSRSLLADATYLPNGKRIVFAGTPKGKGKGGLWSVRPDGSRLNRLTKPDKNRAGVSDLMPDVSPDGRHIVFLRDGSGSDDSRVFVIRSDGKRARPISGDLIYPAYSPVGDLIVGSSNWREGVECSDLFTMSPRGAERQLVTGNCEQVPPGEVGGTAASPSWQPLSNAVSD